LLNNNAQSQLSIFSHQGKLIQSWQRRLFDSNCLCVLFAVSFRLRTPSCARRRVQLHCVGIIRVSGLALSIHWVGVYIGKLHDSWHSKLITFYTYYILIPSRSINRERSGRWDWIESWWRQQWAVPWWICRHIEGTSEHVEPAQPQGPHVPEQNVDQSPRAWSFGDELDLWTNKRSKLIIF